VRYLIDGYNLLFNVNDDVNPLSDARHDIIESLAKQIALRGLKASLIFDSHIQNASLFPTRFYHGCLEIIYTPHGQTADNHIIEKLEWVKHPKTITVVTSDKHLGNECKECGANVMCIDSFLLFLAKKKKHDVQEMQESPHEIERLREIFEKRFTSNDE
jgi:predicted RNA-binding protein with PIN domain